MKNTKRPALRTGDQVTVADHVRTPIRIDGRADVLRETVLRVSSVYGRGSLRSPWTVVVTDGVDFWHFAPDDVAVRA